MALQYPKPNHRSVNEYQMSGLPFTTSSVADEVPANTGTPLQVDFPTLTRWVCITNTGKAHLRAGFTSNGVKNYNVDGADYNITGSGGRYFVITSGSEPVRLELKCTSVFFLSDASGTTTSYSMVAGLTGIEYSQFLNLTGSEGFQGIG